MTSVLHPYAALKSSGVHWLCHVPEHWHVRRLRTVAEMRVSNVDKHTKEDEFPVRLCNYVDVYKNDRITQGIPFMSATASRDEIEKFRLNRNDVVITKDSETWDDIGVPALVTEPADDLISGYHLAILRPSADTHGPYLFWALQSKPICYQFHVEAQGVTRYGLARNGIQSVTLPVPPPEEQAVIVRFLDHADEQVRRYIAGKERLIALLEEEQQALVHQVVTRGLDPDVKLKDSGVDWLGNVPEHWEVVRLGGIGRFSKGNGGTKEDEVPAGIPCIRYGDIYTSHKYSIRASRAYIRPEKTSEYTPLRYGDVLFAGSGETVEEIGKSAVNLIQEPTYSGGDVIIFRPSVQLNAEFAGYVTDSPGAQAQKSVMGRGFTIMHIYGNQLKNLQVALPPTEEQNHIVAHIAHGTARIDEQMNRSRRQIGLMNEYRTRLIADVVTGQLDVREADAQLKAAT